MRNKIVYYKNGESVVVNMYWYVIDESGIMTYAYNTMCQVAIGTRIMKYIDRIEEVFD